MIIKAIKAFYLRSWKYEKRVYKRYKKNKNFRFFINLDLNNVNI